MWYSLNTWYFTLRYVIIHLMSALLQVCGLKPENGFDYGHYCFLLPNTLAGS